VSFPDRGRITDEYLDAIRILWTAEEPRFAGRFAAFDGIRFEPKPRQRPHPPIVVGGRSGPALRRAARVGDGWYGFALTVAQTAPIVAELRRLRARTGRPPLEISLTTFEPLTPELVGRAAETGIDRLIVMPMVGPAALEAFVRQIGSELIASRRHSGPSAPLARGGVPCYPLRMAEDDSQAELERLRKENERLRRTASRGVTLKVSEKGGLSVYGLGRFPVTLYKEQWLKLLDMADELRAFIAENAGALKSKS
jgi:alkanesulfonate monooxygenase SsuD/methylene tetrahydromethanopterin reductase-like flavin-dependent oxidoreductase (luciferase family)